MSGKSNIEKPKRKIVLAEPVLIWKAKGENGETRDIPITDLEDDHLVRVMRISERKLNYHTKAQTTYKGIVKALAKELKKRKLVVNKETEDEKV